MKIYADNAATTKMCPAAIEAMLPFLDRIYGNPSSLHSVGQEAAEALADARQRIAACIGADPGEIVFTSGGSEADNQAILSAARLGAAAGQAAYHIHRIRASRCPAHPGEAEAGGL